MSQEYNLPASINILGHWVKIKYVDNIPSENDYLHGIFEVDKNQITIRIADSVTMYKTLIHELMHGIFAYSGIGQIIDEREEEAICCTIEYLEKLFYLKPKTRYIRLRNSKRRVRTE